MHFTIYNNGLQCIKYNTVLAHKVNPNKIYTYFQHGSSMMFTPLHPGFQLNNHSESMQAGGCS